VNAAPRVLVVTHRMDVGGTEMHLARVLPDLRRRGIDVSIFVLARGGSLESRLTDEGVTVRGPTGSAHALSHNLLAGLTLRRELHRRHYNIIHFFLPAPYLIGSLASAGITGAVRVMSRRSLAVYQTRHWILAQLERRLHRFTEVLLGNSTAVVSELVAECGKQRKVGLIHNGIVVPPAVTVEQRVTLRRSLGISRDAFVLVVNANLIAYKGHADLFDALGGTRNRIAGPWSLLLIGRDMGMGKALRHKAAALGIADHIVWIENQSDAQTLLAAADVAVLPSHEEGFSNSLLEAMACGLPVIATRVGGNVDAVADGESGLLVPIQDPAALMAAISKLLGDGVLRQKLGATARTRVDALFSHDTCVQRYFDLYTHLAKGNCDVQHILNDEVRSRP